MPLIPWSLIPVEPVRSGATVQFIKLKGLKGKEDKNLEEINTCASTPTASRYGDEKTFKTMLFGE